MAAAGGPFMCQFCPNVEYKMLGPLITHCGKKHGPDQASNELYQQLLLQYQQSNAYQKHKKMHKEDTCASSQAGSQL